MFLPHLSELGQLYGTDKYSLHRYTDFYHELLSPLRHEKITLLEIGVLGGESLKMWEAFFGHPLSMIYGVDIHDRAIQERERMKVRIGDGSSRDFIDQLVQETGPLDIVVDDGSHYSDQQKRSLEYLWPHLQPGGLYICEDTHSSYHYPWTSPDDISFVGSLMEWIHRLNERGAGHCGIPSETDIEQVTFRKSVVVIKKR